MAVRIKLGDYQMVTGDQLGRSYTGCFPRMTEAEAWEAGRGVWKMNRARATAERFAFVTGMGKVLAVAGIDGVTQYGDRFALEGQPLSAGHPVYDAYIGRPDPLANQSQNSLTYGDLPEEAAFRVRPCGCGCGQMTRRDFAPGHELKAIQERIRDHFGGSALALIQWIDTAHEHLASRPVIRR
jgi:hypothetical protein